MSASDESYAVLELRWRRLLRGLRRHGVRKTCDKVLDLMRSGDFPIDFSVRLIKYLLKRGEYAAAGTMVKGARHNGATHPLLDKVEVSWLWCIGKRRAALSLALKSAAYWERSYLFTLVAALYARMAQGVNHDRYLRQAEHYRQVAASSAQREESNWLGAREIEKRKAVRNPGRRSS